MKLFDELYKMFEDNEGGSLSCARVITWVSAIIGIILLILYFFGIGQNPEAAYTMIGLGIGGGLTKSITSHKNEDSENTVNHIQEDNAKETN